MNPGYQLAAEVALSQCPAPLMGELRTIESVF